MKNQFTKEFRAVLERKLRVYYRHYSYQVHTILTFKEFCRKSALKKPLFFSENFKGLCSPQPLKIPINEYPKPLPYIKIKIGNAQFDIIDDLITLSTVYRNANRKDCRC